MNLVELFFEFYSNSHNDDYDFKKHQATGGHKLEVWGILFGKKDLKGEIMTSDERGIWMAGQSLPPSAEG